MTRKSRRELENDLDELTDGSGTGPSDLMIVHEDPETGEWFRDAEHEDPVAPAVAEQADPLMIVCETVVETDWDPETGIK